MGAQCGPLNAVLTSGLPAGPIHPQVGDLVATKRGPRPISLEGFSEDDNQGLCRPYCTCRTCCLLCTCRSYCTRLSCTCTCDLYHHLHPPCGSSLWTSPLWSSSFWPSFGRCRTCRS